MKKILGIGNALVDMLIRIEDEKTLGSIHVAFGNNMGFGGVNKARIHLDGVVKNPSVWLDEKPIIKKGNFLI